MPSFVLQCCERPVHDAAPTIGIGFTASRRVGKAVARNRAKRRLRAVAREVLPAYGRPGHEYVLIARTAVLTWPYPQIRHELETALTGLHKGGARRAEAAAGSASSPRR